MTVVNDDEDDEKVECDDANVDKGRDRSGGGGNKSGGGGSMVLLLLLLLSVVVVVANVLTHRQVQPLQARVDLGAIAMKGYSAFPKAPAFMESQIV